MEGRTLFACANLVILMAFIPACAVATMCTGENVHYFASPSCLQAVQTAAEDTNRFWFGNDYTKNCNDKSEFDSECFNLRPDSRDSLVSRIFQNRAYDSKAMRFVLEVTYKTNTGSYEACGNTYHVSESREVIVDPLQIDDADTDLTPFDCLTRPTVSWGFGKTSSSHHTLAIIDAGYLTVQALYANIPGDSLLDDDASTTIVEYQAPLNPTRNSNPYVFLLFEQNGGPIQLNTRALHDLSSRSLKAFEDFLTKHNLRGPVGISWFTLRSDPYSADNADKTPGRMNTCAYFVNEAFVKERYIPYLPENRPPLNTYIDIFYDSPAFEFSCCCNKYSRQHGTFKPNPIADAIGDAAIMRVNATWIFRKSTAFPSRTRDFGSDLYTMVMADPFMYTKSLPHMHQLVINIRDGQLETGQHLLPYMGPWSPHTYYHRYYFLLFKQTVPNFQPRPEDYSYKNCAPVFQGRCGFDMTRLIKDGGLELVGASWQRVKLSNYVRCIYANLPGWDESKECASVPGYSPTCSESPHNEL